MNELDEKILLDVLRKKPQMRVPFWLMRQAGRYLPEYRELRDQAGSFLDLVYNPELATEITLQPVRRFGMDAAILFSDILVIPHALGQELTFVDGEGPKLDPVKSEADVARLSAVIIDEKLEPIYKTVSDVRKKLGQEFPGTALIGFAGAPWTVACYMVEGGSSRDFAKVKGWAYRDPEGFSKLIDVITEATISYLSRQIDAGAEAVKLFDSWAGVIDPDLFQRYVIAPTRRIIEHIRSSYPEVPIIGFPRGAGQLYLNYVQQVPVDAVALDQQVPMNWASGVLQHHTAVQGNLDPVCLLEGGDAMVLSLERILSGLSGGPFIFNLGHGVMKETPPEHVEQLAEIVRGWVV